MTETWPLIVVYGYRIITFRRLNLFAVRFETSASQVLTIG